MHPSTARREVPARRGIGLSGPAQESHSDGGHELVVLGRLASVDLCGRAAGPGVAKVRQLPLEVVDLSDTSLELAREAVHPAGEAGGPSVGRYIDSVPVPRRHDRPFRATRADVRHGCIMALAVWWWPIIME